MTQLTIPQFEELKGTAVLIDTRQPSIFTLGFMPSAINIALGEEFIESITTLLPFEAPLILLAEKDDLEDSYEALTTLGFKNIKGHIKGGFATWKKAGKTVDMIIDVSGDELALDLPFDPKLLLVDVRTPIEFEKNHIKKAENFPLKDIVNPLHLAQLDDEGNIYVYGQNNFQSVLACSVMKKEGFHNIRNIDEGFETLKSSPNLKFESIKGK